MDLRFPVGKFQYEGPNTHQQQQDLIAQIADTPTELRKAVTGCQQSNWRYPIVRTAGRFVRLSIISLTVI